VPLIGPVADKLGIDLIWFGVLLGVNMQTSFMHPPFGFALFYLRSVAPTKDYVDKATGKLTPKVTTGQIYWGAVPFVLIQIIMVALIITFPGLVTGGLVKKAAIDTNKIQIEVPAEEQEMPGQPGGEDSSGRQSEQEDTQKAFDRAAGGASPVHPPAAKGTDKAPSGRGK
jgi:hypothetical protein